MIYEYQGTIITVRPGLGGDNWATCKLKTNGGWTTVKSPDMKRTERLDEAINNLHDWAKRKGLRRADCSCCYNQSGNKCAKHNKALKAVDVVIFGKTHLRCVGCNEFEKYQC